MEGRDVTDRDGLNLGERVEELERWAITAGEEITRLQSELRGASEWLAERPHCRDTAVCVHAALRSPAEGECTHVEWDPESPKFADRYRAAEIQAGDQ